MLPPSVVLLKLRCFRVISFLASNSSIISSVFGRRGLARRIFDAKIEPRSEKAISSSRYPTGLVSSKTQIRGVRHGANLGLRGWTRNFAQRIQMADVDHSDFCDRM